MIQNDVYPRGSVRLQTSKQSLKQASHRKLEVALLRCINRSGHQLKLSHFLSTGWATLHNFSGDYTMAHYMDESTQGLAQLTIVNIILCERSGL